MSLFQTQVERQFLSDITTDLTPIYKKFVDYFGNPAIHLTLTVFETSFFKVLNIRQM